MGNWALKGEEMRGGGGGGIQISYICIMDFCPV